MSGTVTVGVMALAIMAAGDGTDQSSPAHDSLAMLAHWRCSAWASMANDEIAAESHFTSGLESGRRFVEAARSGLISKTEWSETIPLSVAMTASGPTSDFVLGRLFEFISDDAFEQVTRRDLSGRLLSPEEYILDDALQSVNASNLFNRSNCKIL